VLDPAGSDVRPVAPKRAFKSRAARPIKCL
jgi:hypothetical protein